MTDIPAFRIALDVEPARVAVQSLTALVNRMTIEEMRAVAGLPTGFKDWFMLEEIHTDMQTGVVSSVVGPSAKMLDFIRDIEARPIPG